MHTIDPNATATTTAAPAAAKVETTTTAPAVVPAPAVTTTAPSLEAIKEARHEAASTAEQTAAEAAVAEAAAAVVAAKEAEAAKASEANSAAALVAKLAETQAQAGTLAEKAKVAEKLEKAAELAKSGKHLEAIQALGADGIDFDKAVFQALNPGAPIPESETAKPAADELPAVKALREQVEALNKKLSDAESAAIANAKEMGRRTVVAHVKETAENFPYLATNEDWINAALKSAEPDYDAAVKANKDQDITQEAKDEIINKALAREEAKHKEIAAKYAAIGGKSGPTETKTPNSVTKAAPMFNSLTYTGANKAGITPAVKLGKGATIEELKRARRFS